MGGIMLLGAFEACGVAVTERLAARRGIITRVWLGLSLGLIMMMWFPALFAFFMDFTSAAQWCALALAMICAAAAWFFTRNRVFPARRHGEIPWKLLAAIVVPLTILGGYLEYTHIIRESAGALYVGQSTYGDLCLHLGIATGLRDAAFPPTYTLLQGVELGYPFLSDSLVTSMLLFGTALRPAFMVSGILMLMLVFGGFAIFAWQMTGSAMATAVSSALMFINGGFGFIYMFDSVTGGWHALQNVFTGFYLTPTNMPAYNLRWVNVIADMLIPQRTLLAGWAVLMPALYMLTELSRRPGRRINFEYMGLWAGAMPMIHTHSFFALGMLSVGIMVSSIVRADKNRRLETAFNFLIYGVVAVVLAAPQLLEWTFPQTAGGGSLGFLFNWVNNDGSGGLIDEYFWFWIKNVGVVFLLAVPAALSSTRTGRALALGALVIYVVAELFQFQPNIYDNNKLFYVAYIAVVPLVGAFIAKVWRRLKGLKCRTYLMVLVLILGCISGAMSLGREVVSEYRLFSPEEAMAGAFADEDTPRDAVFLTGSQHNNPVTSLAGRQIVCGTPTYLHFHGIDYSRQMGDEQLMYEAPAENASLFEQYGVDFVYISSYERGSYAVNEDWFAENCDKVFESGNVVIYRFADGLLAEE